MARIRARVATSHPTETVYGEIALTEENLVDIVTGLNGGLIPMTFNHDADHTLTATNVNSGIESTDDGFKAVWAEFDVPDGEWEFVSEQLKHAGVPGGFSYTAGEVIYGPKVGAEIELAADAYHFTDSEITEAAELLAPNYSVQAQHIFQFSIIPDAAIFVSLAMSVLESVPANIISQLLYDSLRGLLRPNRENVFNFRLKAKDGKITAKIRIATSDPEVLRATVQQLPETFQQALEGVQND
jgi:hypothetical protein